MEVSVKNIVATSEVADSLDLSFVENIFLDNLHPAKGLFPGVVLKDGNVSILVFSTGKLVIAGGRSVDEIARAVAMFVSRLAEAGVKVKKPYIHIQNIVAAGSLGYRVNLDVLADAVPDSIYEPEIFPGLVIRFRDNHTTALLFYSGSFVIVGARTEEDVVETAKKLSEIVEKSGAKTDHPA